LKTECLRAFCSVINALREGNERREKRTSSASLADSDYYNSITPLLDSNWTLPYLSGYQRRYAPILVNNYRNARSSISKYADIREQIRNILDFIQYYRKIVKLIQESNRISSSKIPIKRIIKGNI